MTLLVLAAQVGSDVPFFASGEPAALARGRGELLERVRSRQRPGSCSRGRGSSSATADVYARFRPSRGVRASASRNWPAGHSGEADAAHLARLVENDLAGSAEALCPPIAALRAQLLARGALCACVSGSGSAVFGLFDREDRARAACAALAAAEPWAAVAPLPRSDAGARIKP